MRYTGTFKGGGDNERYRTSIYICSWTPENIRYLIELLTDTLKPHIDADSETIVQARPVEYMMAKFKSKLQPLPDHM